MPTVSKTHIAVTPQQQQLTSGNPAKVYKEISVGDASWLTFVLFELYNLIICGLGGATGLFLRGLCLKGLLKSCGRGPMVGRDVTIRQPGRIEFGDKVTIDDQCLLDVRTGDSSDAEIAAKVGIKIGSKVYLGRNSFLKAKYGRVVLADGVNIGSFTRIATQGTIEIGNSVLISSYVYIGAGNHGFNDSSTAIIEQEMGPYKGIKIGDNTWIGAKATILDGVTIGKDAIIGAHSLVRDDVPDRAIVVGTPAKILKFRG
jgi:acetyltransferase-like isoleucine patch superfamily enzyme